jgi:hypothetical protein
MKPSGIAAAHCALHSDRPSNVCCDDVGLLPGATAGLPQSCSAQRLYGDGGGIVPVLTRSPHHATAEPTGTSKPPRAERPSLAHGRAASYVLLQHDGVRRRLRSGYDASCQRQQTNRRLRRSTQMRSERRPTLQRQPADPRFIRLIRGCSSLPDLHFENELMCKLTQPPARPDCPRQRKGSHAS